MPVRRLLGWPDPGQVALSALIGILLAFYAGRFLLPNTVLAGTMNSVLLLLLTAGWASWLRRRDVVTGALVGVAAIFKLFPLALLPYLVWRRHWKLVAALCLTGVGGLAVGLVVTSLDHNIYYFRDMLPHLAAGTGYRENQSLAGFTARICQPSTADAGGSAGWCGRLLDWPLILLLVVVVLRATSRASRSGLEFGLAISTLPLISSVTWSFHLVLLILPIVLLIRLAFTGALSRVAGRVLIAAWLCFSVLPALHYLLIVHPLPHWPGILDLVPLGFTRFAGEAYFIGTLIIFTSVLFVLRNERRAAAAADPPALAA